MNSIQKEAVRLAQLGLSVVRIAPRGKRPLETSWLPFTERARTPKQARLAFATPSEIGLVTGPVSGLVVVDADADEAKGYVLRTLPVTPLIAVTPRGGFHLYYRYPAGVEIGSPTQLLGMALDIRATRAVVVIPPSVGANGKRYRWFLGRLTEEVLAALPVFAPGWLESAKPRARPAVPIAERSSTARARAQNYISRIEAISGNGGHNATYRATCELFERGLSKDEALEELMIWNRTNASPPWTEKELIHKVRSVYEGPSSESHGRLNLESS